MLEIKVPSLFGCLLEFHLDSVTYHSKRKWLRLFDKFVNTRLRISGWLKKKRWWERLINIRLAIEFYSTGKNKIEKSRITSGSETNVIHFWVSPSVSRSFIFWAATIFLSRYCIVSFVHFFREVIHHFLFSFFFVCCPKICHRDWGKQTSKYPGHFYFVEKRTKIYVCLSACVCVCGRYMGRGWIPSWNSSGQWPRHYVTSAIHGETPVSPIISLFIFVVVFFKIDFRHFLGGGYLK